MGTMHIEAWEPWSSHPFGSAEAETKRMKAAAKASKRAVWPPKPKGIKPPNLKPPGLMGAHPIAWVTAALHATSQMLNAPDGEAERLRYDGYLAEYGDWREAHGFPRYSTEERDECPTTKD